MTNHSRCNGKKVAIQASNMDRACMQAEAEQLVIICTHVRGLLRIPNPKLAQGLMQAEMGKRIEEMGKRIEQNSAKGNSGECTEPLPSESLFHQVQFRDTNRPLT
jgi:hypothetical protein